MIIPRQRMAPVMVVEYDHSQSENSKANIYNFQTCIHNGHNRTYRDEHFLFLWGAF